MNPGLTTCPDASSSAASRSAGSSPTATIRSSSTAMSPRRPGAPVPSTTVPPRMTSVTGMWPVSAGRDQQRLVRPSQPDPPCWCGLTARSADTGARLDAMTDRQVSDLHCATVALHPATVALHTNAVVVDTHNDLLMLVARR